MSHSRGNIIDPKLITDISSFEWMAKLLASGFMHGKHEASRLGTGMEFQQYRPYVSGDDIRGIDWKMYAKTDKFYIKQTSILTEHQYVFILDNTKSMEYEEEGWTKLFFGKILLAAMMRVLANQGDHFAWQSGANVFRMGAGMRHWQHSLETIYQLETSKNADFVDPIKNQTTTFIWISDFYAAADEIKNYVKKLKNPKTELIMFHVLGEAEKNLDFSSNATFVDLESGKRLDVNASKSRENYRRKLNAHAAMLRNLSFESGAYYEEVLINEPITESLRRFFHHYQYTSA